MSIPITTVVRDFLTDPSIEEMEIVGDSFRRVIGPDDTIKTLREFADMEVVSYDKVPIQWIVGEGGRKIIKKWRYILYV